MGSYAIIWNLALKFSRHNTYITDTYDYAYAMLKNNDKMILEEKYSAKFLTHLTEAKVQENFYLVNLLVH